MKTLPKSQKKPPSKADGQARRKRPAQRQPSEYPAAAYKRASAGILRPADILTLQQTLGNRAVQRLLDTDDQPQQRSHDPCPQCGTALSGPSSRTDAPAAGSGKVVQRNPDKCPWCSKDLAITKHVGLTGLGGKKQTASPTGTQQSPTGSPGSSGPHTLTQAVQWGKRAKGEAEEEESPNYAFIHHTKEQLRKGKLTPEEKRRKQHEASLYSEI